MLVNECSYNIVLCFSALRSGRNVESARDNAKDRLDTISVPRVLKAVFVQEELVSTHEVRVREGAAVQVSVLSILFVAKESRQETFCG